MKKNIVILIVILMAIDLQGQQSGIIGQRSSAACLEKSKRQRTVAFVFLGSGVSLFTGGIVAMQHSMSKGENEILFVLGGMTMVTASIPFFIASFGNKHKAKLYMNREAIILLPEGKGNIVYNSIGVRITL